MHHRRPCVTSHDDVRDDIAAALANLAHRRGTERDQQQILDYLDEARRKPRAASA
jgi:hypothetical protein